MKSKGINRKKIISTASMIAVLIALPFLSCHGSNQHKDIDTQSDDDSYMRENPDFDFESPFDISTIQIPEFIDRPANTIELNGSDWSEIIHKFHSNDPRTLTIVHIGDSHIQAEISTDVTRERLQLVYGSAGRGLIAPLKLSGTNQPKNYKFESDSKWSVDKVMRPNGSQPMGFNGMSLSLIGKSGNFRITLDDCEDTVDPFTKITVYHTGSFNVSSVKDEYGNPVNFGQKSKMGKTDIYLSDAATCINIGFKTSDHLTLHGALLSGERPGLFYHAIGNNGANFSTYNHINSFTSGIKDLNPDIIIISLGTNDAFGRRDEIGFSQSVSAMIRSLEKECPHSKILIITPMECQKGQGRKRKRSYSVNENVALYRDELLKICREHGIASYDWYAIAGGKGASNQWLNDGLMGSDRVHFTTNGYRVQGLLLYHALYELIEQVSEDFFVN